jgi:hypothetical protein
MGTMGTAVGVPRMFVTVMITTAWFTAVRVAVSRSRYVRFSTVGMPITRRLKKRDPFVTAA